MHVQYSVLWDSFQQRLTLRRHSTPLRVGKVILALSYSLSHPRRNGCSMVTVERWKTTQPTNQKQQQVLILNSCFGFHLEDGRKWTKRNDICCLDAGNWTPFFKSTPCPIVRQFFIHDPAMQFLKGCLKICIIKKADKITQESICKKKQQQRWNTMSKCGS